MLTICKSIISLSEQECSLRQSIANEEAGVLSLEKKYLLIDQN